MFAEFPSKTVTLSSPRPADGDRCLGAKAQECKQVSKGIDAEQTISYGIEKSLDPFTKRAA